MYEGFRSNGIIPENRLYDINNLFSPDSTDRKFLEDVLSFAGNLAGSDTLCVVIFSPDSEHECLCSHTNEPEMIKTAVNLAVRLCEANVKPLDAAEFSEQLTPGERDTLNIGKAMFLQLIEKQKAYGALWCAYPEQYPASEFEGMMRGIGATVTTALKNRHYKAENTLRAKVLTGLLENLDANICVLDPETDEILFVNKNMRDDFGITGDIKGTKCWEVFQKDVNARCSFCPANEWKSKPYERIAWEDHNIVTGKHYKNTDIIIEWLDGKSAHLQHSVDITAEKTVQQRLLDAKHSADHASKAKGDFLSRMSHEIRTPLNAIIGMTKIAIGAGSLEKTKDCLKKIDGSSVQLLALINDILDISQIEADKMVLNNEPFDFEKMLLDISNIITVKSEEKKQKLYINMNVDMPRYYIGDEMRISQVVTNLLSNAVKFTPQNGAIHMGVNEKARINDESIIEVSVTDTGIGIPKEQSAHIFGAFEQADGGIARRFGGTGLGLAISRNIVQMMGGDINVRSEPSKGSTFTFTIKLLQNKDMKPPEEPYRNMDLGSLNVLLMDEAAETREYFLSIMERFRIKADAVSTIEEGFEKLDRKSYQIVFLDWDIESTGGLALCKSIKERYGSCIVVLISMSGFNDIEDQAEQSGVFKYISKPLFPSTLLNVISEAVGLPSSRTEPIKSKRYTFAGYQILIAEDVEVNRDVMALALEDTKIRIDFAENGQVALQKFKADPCAYDLILMDVNMPVMDGYIATKEIRRLNHPRAGAIPILAMTANAFAEDIKQSLSCGMNDHLTKPVDFDQLFSKLKQYLIEYKLILKEEVQSTMSVQQSVNPQSSDLPDIPGLADYIDVADALKRVRGNKKIYKTLLNSFVNNSKIDDLVTQVKSGDYDEGAKTAHSIKGASANLSLTAVYNSSMEIERQLKEGSCDDAILEQCKADFDKTKDFIAELIKIM